MSRRLAEGFTGDATGVGRESTVAVVALGANLGDRENVLAEALRDIARLPLVDDVRVSEPIESVAITLDGPDEAAPPYLNAVALVTTRLAPSVLLTYLHGIEARHGRERRVQWGDRTLDLDLVSYGDMRSGAPDLRLPHPRAAQRDFVLAPWLAIDPEAVLPGAGRVDELLARLRETP